MNTIIAFHRQVPSKITINRNWSCRPSEPETHWKKPYLDEPATVESVKRALEIGGPFVAISALGPRRYTVNPIQFNNLIPDYPDVPVYGWKSGAEKSAEKFKQFIIICGVQRREGKEQIYYVLADDVSENREMAIGTCQTSTDKRVFGASLATYNEGEFDMFPPVNEGEIERYKSQRVVPPFLAGKPELISSWGKGEIVCQQSPDGKTWEIRPRDPSRKLSAIQHNKS